MKRLAIASLILAAFPMRGYMADDTPAATPVLYFNPETKVIFASSDPQDSAIQPVAVDAVAALVADGATVDVSAQPLIDATVPEVTITGEPTGSMNSSEGSDAANTAPKTLISTSGSQADPSSSPASESVSGASAASGGDGPLDASAAATSPTAVATSTGSSTGSSAASDASTDSDSGNGGASDAAAASGNVSGATAADASDLSGTEGSATTGSDSIGDGVTADDTPAVVTILVNGLEVKSFASGSIAQALTKATRAYPDSQHPIHEVLSALETEVHRPSAFIKDNFLAILQRGRALYNG